MVAPGGSSPELPDRYHRAGLPRLVIFEQEVVLQPGSAELLRFLSAAGTRISCAGACREDVVRCSLAAQGLDRFVDHVLGLESSEGGTSSDLVRRALAEGGTRDAVLIGSHDRDAAAAAVHGVPFVRRVEDPEAGGVTADAIARSQAEILECLGGRVRLLRRLEEWLGGAGRIAVTGPSGVGKSLLAARLADLLGAPLLATDAFLSQRPGPPPGGDHLGHAFDLEALRRDLTSCRGPRVTEGIFLEDPRLRPCFDRIIHLRAETERVVDRARARDGEQEAAAVRDRYLPAWRAFPAHRMADPDRLVVDMTSILEPRIVFGRPV